MFISISILILLKNCDQYSIAYYIKLNIFITMDMSLLALSKKSLYFIRHSLINKPVDPKGNQSCIFIARTDGEAEALTLRSLDVN